MPDHDDPFRPPEAEVSPPPQRKKFPRSWFLTWIFAPLVCAILGAALKGDWIAFITLGFVIFIPCAIFAGVLAASHFKDLGRPNHALSGSSIAVGLMIFDFIALFIGCSAGFRPGG